MIRRHMLVVVLNAATVLGASGAAAQTDHLNLEEGIPTQVEDAYPTAFRNREFQIGPRYERADGGGNRVQLDPRIEIGPLRNTQLAITVPVLLGSADQTGSGDIQVDALYNFNTEGLSLPALSLGAQADFPTGEGRQGVDAQFKFLATKSISNRLARLHLNVIYARAGDPSPSERRNRYRAILGYSGRFGPDMILVADAVREQLREEGANSNVVELGLRRQMTPLIVLALGIGAGIGEESPDVRITLGLQRTLTFFSFF